MIARTSLVLRAVELRGYDMSRPRWHQFSRWPDYAKRLSRCVVLVTVPLLIGTLRGTTTMAMVADARGFGASKRRGSLRVHKTTAVDVWGYVILAVAGGGRARAQPPQHRCPLLRMKGQPPVPRGRPDQPPGATGPHRSPQHREEIRCASTQSCSTTAVP